MAYAPSSVHRKKINPFHKLHPCTQLLIHITHKGALVCIRRRIKRSLCVCPRECSLRCLLHEVRTAVRLPAAWCMYIQPKITRTSSCLTDGLSVQCVQDQLGRFVVSEVDESVSCDDAPVPVTDEFNLKLLPWKRNRYESWAWHMRCRRESRALAGRANPTKEGSSALVADEGGRWAETRKQKRMRPLPQRAHGPPSDMYMSAPPRGALAHRSKRRGSPHTPQSNRADFEEDTGGGGGRGWGRRSYNLSMILSFLLNTKFRKADSKRDSYRLRESCAELPRQSPRVKGS